MIARAYRGSVHLGVISACVIGCALTSTVRAQERPQVDNMGMFYPCPYAVRGWNASVGLVTITTPEDLTEEVRVRVPAIDVHGIYRLDMVHRGLYLDGRVLVQFVQNHFQLGVGWALPLNERWSFSFGSSIGHWRGNMPIAGFDAKGSGWMHYPQLSLGYRSRKDLLFTLRTEMLLRTEHAYVVGSIAHTYDTDRVAGLAASIYMEQPFFKRSYVTLGFTLVYTDHYWATWSLFETFQRKQLFPLITTSLIL